MKVVAVHFERLDDRLTVGFEDGTSVVHLSCQQPAYDAFAHASSLTAHYRKYIEPVYPKHVDIRSMDQTVQQVSTSLRSEDAPNA